MIFPLDAITQQIEASGSITVFIDNTNATKTILAVSMQQQNIASDSHLQCGGVDIFVNFAKDTAFNLTQFKCAAPLTLVKMGNDISQTVITYVKRDIQFSSEVATNTPANIDPTITYGDIVTNIQIFLVAAVAMVGVYHLLFRTIKVKNRKK